MRNLGRTNFCLKSFPLRWYLLSFVEKTDYEGTFSLPRNEASRDSWGLLVRWPVRIAILLYQIEIIFECSQIYSVTGLDYEYTPFWFLFPTIVIAAREMVGCHPPPYCLKRGHSANCRSKLTKLGKWRLFRRMGKEFNEIIYTLFGIFASYSHPSHKNRWLRLWFYSIIWHQMRDKTNVLNAYLDHPS